MLTAFLIVFFTACAAAASYVTAVLLTYLMTRFYLYAPYDVFAYLSCPFSGTCIEFGADFRKMTLFAALDMFVTVAVILPLLYAFRDKIKDKVLSKIPLPARLNPTAKIKAFFGKVKTKIRRRSDATD